MKKHRFYNESFGWYIDLPGWPGPKAALAMVAGADTLLDKLANYKDEVVLEFDTKSFDSYEFKIVRNSLRALGVGGADYTSISENPVINNHNLWLCPVTLYVFNGKYPKEIYLKVFSI